MIIDDIFDKAQYVVDSHGRQTAVLIDVDTWKALRHFLEEAFEDRVLGELMDLVQDDVKFEGEAALEAYRAFLAEVE